MMKLLGACMVLFSCGGIGFSVVASHRHQEQSLQQLLRALDYMNCELQYRLTPLPELCRGASKACTGCVSDVLHQLSLELDAQIAPDAAACMYASAAKHPTLPEKLRRCLTQLGDILGRFDLSGQLQGLESVKRLAEYELDQLRNNQDIRLRSYQTLGFCVGFALVVLFL